MASKVVLVTGGNTGLGLEIIRALYESSQNYSILLGSRSLDKADSAIAELKGSHSNTSTTIEPIQVDVEDDASINAACETVQKKYGHLDVLINNAGATFDLEIMKGTITMRQMWDKSWSVNVTGTYIMTDTFAPLLLKSSDPRLLFITSGTANLAGHDNQAIAMNHYPNKGWPKQGMSVTAYRSAKTGMNMMMREWFRMFKEDGVKVWAVSPGFLATNLGGAGSEMLKRMGALDPKIGGELIRDVVEGKRDADVGKVVDGKGIQPW